MSERFSLFLGVAGLAAAVGGAVTIGLAARDAQANLELFETEVQSSIKLSILDGEVEAVDAAHRSFDLKIINPFPPSSRVSEMNPPHNSVMRGMKNPGFFSYRFSVYGRTILNSASLLYVDKAVNAYVPGSVTVLSENMKELKPGMRVRVFGKHVSDDGVMFRYQADIINTIRQ